MEGRESSSCPERVGDVTGGDRVFLPDAVHDETVFVLAGIQLQDDPPDPAGVLVKGGRARIPAS